MELVFMSSDGAFIGYKAELEVTKFGIIISHKMNAVGLNFIYLKLFLQIDKFKDKAIIQAYKTFVSPNPNGISENDIDKFYSDLLSIRNRKHKQKADLIYLAKLEIHFRNVKTDVINFMQSFFVANKMDVLLDFVKSDDFVIHDGIIKPDTENIFHKTLMEEFSTPDFYHIFDFGIFMKQKEDIIYDVNEQSDPDLCYSNILFSIPDLNNLSYPQMNIIRNYFHENLIPFYDLVSKMKSEFDDVILTTENMVEINKRFDELIVPMVPEVKSIADNNIYFQQIRNSTESKDEKRFNIGIGKIRTVVNMYKNRNVITDAEEEFILNEISRTKSPDSCCVFFFLELAPDAVN
jgi:hypothetical protein